MLKGLSILTQSKRIIIAPREQHYEAMEKTLTDFWARHLWNVKECPLFTDKWKSDGRNLYWERYQNEFIRTEMKYYTAHKLILGQLSLYNVFQTSGNTIHKFGDFINSYFPRIKTIIDIPKPKLEMMWRTYLQSLNIQTSKTPKSWIRVKQNENRDGYYTVSTGTVNFISKFYDFFLDFYDDRDEYEKDIWDGRKLGIPVNSSQSEAKINFTRVPYQFKDLMKKYVKLRLNQLTAFSTIIGNLSNLVRFLDFIDQSYPKWNDLKDISRKDIENYLQYLRETPMGGVSRNSNYLVLHQSKYS